MAVPLRPCFINLPAAKPLREQRRAKYIDSTLRQHRQGGFY